MHPKQSGSMLVISIFIIIVMTLLGLAMSSMLSASADSVVHEVYGVRALNAARSGLEQHLMAVFPADMTAQVANCNTITHDFTNVAGLEHCQFSSACVNQSYTLSSGAAETFSFTSTGSCQAGDMLVSRTINVDAMERL
ncbi:type II secretory pathway protein [Alteromonadaceae bacterium BrNp21-10]|nr:type II secretory pathway protein [Alteromonadaceae bacterium BrNp21-10]